MVGEHDVTLIYALNHDMAMRQYLDVEGKRACICTLIVNY